MSMQINMKKLFQKTEAILKKEGLWPDAETKLAVEYADAGNVEIASAPKNYELTFTADFDRSGGTYVDIYMMIYGENTPEQEKLKIGTIKTLADNRDALSAYAALGANFVYYLRIELYNAIGMTFADKHLLYEVYSLNGPDYFAPITADPQKLLSEMYMHHEEYQKVDEGEFFVTSFTYPVKICNYLLEKSCYEVGRPIEVGDVIYIRFTGKENTISYTFLCMDNNQNSPVFNPIVFK